MTITFRKQKLFGARNSRGFTLLELMAAIAVLAILVAIAAPNFQRLIADQQIRTAAETLQRTLLLARSEAIKRNGDVSIEATDEGWHSGWSVRAGGSVSAGGVVVMQQDPLSGVEVDSTLAEITYSRTGRTTQASDLVMRICSEPARGGTERIVRIRITGMVEVERGDACPS